MLQGPVRAKAELRNCRVDAGTRRHFVSPQRNARLRVSYPPHKGVWTSLVECEIIHFAFRLIILMEEDVNPGLLKVS